MTEIITDTITMAGRTYTCFACGSTIDKGTPYRLAKWQDYSHIWTTREHRGCAEIMQARCDDRYWQDELWDYVAELEDSEILAMVSDPAEGERICRLRKEVQGE